VPRGARSEEKATEGRAVRHAKLLHFIAAEGHDRVSPAVARPPIFPENAKATVAQIREVGSTRGVFGDPTP